jgi:hypothetical protein
MCVGTPSKWICNSTSDNIPVHATHARTGTVRDDLYGEFLFKMFAALVFNGLIEHHLGQPVHTTPDEAGVHAEVEHLIVAADGVVVHENNLSGAKGTEHSGPLSEERRRHCHPPHVRTAHRRLKETNRKKKTVTLKSPCTACAQRMVCDVPLRKAWIFMPTFFAVT